MSKLMYNDRAYTFWF